MRNARALGAPAPERAALLIRLLLETLFIAHLYWKFVIFPGGLEAWWENLLRAGYPAFVPAYVLSAEVAGAALLIPGALSRYVALYAMPMMLGAAHFWMARKGFFFTKAGPKCHCFGSRSLAFRSSQATAPSLLSARRTRGAPSRC